MQTIINIVVLGSLAFLFIRWALRAMSGIKG